LVKKPVVIRRRWLRFVPLLPALLTIIVARIVFVLFKPGGICTVCDRTEAHKYIWGLRVGLGLGCWIFGLGFWIFTFWER
jgi:hypothetical protein